MVARVFAQVAEFAGVLDFFAQGDAVLLELFEFGLETVKAFARELRLKSCHDVSPKSKRRRRALASGICVRRTLWEVLVQAAV